MCSIGSDTADLNGNVGAVGKAFATAGGPNVQDGFKKIGGLKTAGSVFLSKDVGPLRCAAILYVRILEWNGNAKVRLFLWFIFS